MKKSEIALLILIVAASIGIAYGIGQAILGNASSKAVEVETVQAITPEISRPNETVFNDKAINPTVPVRIGSPSNQQPFGNN